MTVEEQLTKDQILAGLPQPRLLRRPGLRRRGRRAALLRRQRRQARPCPRPPCSPASRSSPGATDPVPYPEARPGPPQRRPRPDAPAAADHRPGRGPRPRRSPSKVHAQGDRRRRLLRALDLPVLLRLRHRVLSSTQQPALGKTIAERTKNINRGGLTIQTTIDPKIQKQAQKELDRSGCRSATTSTIGAAAAVVEPGTGKILVDGAEHRYSNSAGKGQTSVNYAADKAYGGSGGLPVRLDGQDVRASSRR